MDLTVAMLLIALFYLIAMMAIGFHKLQPRGSASLDQAGLEALKARHSRRPAPPASMISRRARRRCWTDEILNTPIQDRPRYFRQKLRW